MTVSLGEEIEIAFGNENGDQEPANAVSIVGTLWRNAASTATAVTITNVETGVYKFAFTVPSGYADGDHLQVRIVSDGIARFVWGEKIKVSGDGTFLDAI